MISKISITCLLGIILLFFWQFGTTGDARATLIAGMILVGVAFLNSLQTDQQNKRHQQIETREIRKEVRDRKDKYWDEYFAIYMSFYDALVWFDPYSNTTRDSYGNTVNILLRLTSGERLSDDENKFIEKQFQKRDEIFQILHAQRLRAKFIVSQGLFDYLQTIIEKMQKAVKYARYEKLARVNINNDDHYEKKAETAMNVWIKLPEEVAKLDLYFAEYLKR